MPVKVLKLIDDPHLVLGVVEVAGGIVRDASPNLRAIASELATRMGAADYEIPEEKRRAVRQLLKLGGFSPTGRNRPAHELIVNDLKERGEFHHINNVVDVNNVISLQSLLPISIFDLDKLSLPLTVRLGEPGEGYVFNQSGQWLDVKHCIICCGGEAPGVPIGSPVKDSMATKIFEGASNYLGVIYGTTTEWTTYGLTGIVQQFADLLSEETGGRIVQANLCSTLQQPAFSA